MRTCAALSATRCALGEMAAKNAFEVLGKTPKPLLTEAMESAARKYPQWRSRILEMGKISTYRRKSFQELSRILTNENYARSGLSSVQENLSSLVEYINGKLTKVQHSSLSVSEQKAFIESANSKIAALKDKINILAFGGQLYVKSHRSVKKFIGLLELKGVYIEASDHGQYEMESENLSTYIALKDCLENDLEQFINFIIKRGEVNRQYHLDLQDKSVCIRADAKKKKQQKLNSLAPPHSVYIPLVKVLLSADNGQTEGEGEVQDAVEGEVEVEVEGEEKGEVEGEVEPETEQDQSQGDQIVQNKTTEELDEIVQNKTTEELDEKQRELPPDKNESDIENKKEWEDGQESSDCWLRYIKAWVSYGTSKN